MGLIDYWLWRPYYRLRRWWVMRNRRGSWTCHCGACRFVFNTNAVQSWWESQAGQLQHASSDGMTKRCKRCYSVLRWDGQVETFREQVNSLLGVIREELRSIKRNLRKSSK